MQEETLKTRPLVEPGAGYDGRAGEGIALIIEARRPASLLPQVAMKQILTILQTRKQPGGGENRARSR